MVFEAIWIKLKCEHRNCKGATMSLDRLYSLLEDGLVWTIRVSHVPVEELIRMVEELDSPPFETNSNLLDYRFRRTVGRVRVGLVDPDRFRRETTFRVMREKFLDCGAQEVALDVLLAARLQVPDFARRHIYATGCEIWATDIRKTSLRPCLMNDPYCVASSNHLGNETILHPHSRVLVIVP